MRILIAAAAIALAPYSVLASVPAHAAPTCSYVLDPVSGQTKQICEQYRGPNVADNAWSVCTEQGKEQACQACKNALAALGDQNLSGWACGMNGTQRFYGDTKPPCDVIDGTNPTDQAGCDGTMLINGSILRKSGETVPKPQLQFPS